MDLKPFLCMVTLLVALPSSSQLDVGDQFLPEPTPTRIPSEEIPVDEDAVRALTRRIPSGIPDTSPKELSASERAAKTYFQTVAKRLAAAPENIQVIIEVDNGRRESAVLSNILMKIDTSAGALPVQLSEISQLKRDDSAFLIELIEGDRFSGSPELSDLHLEREDGSEWILPIRKLTLLRVITENKP